MRGRRSRTAITSQRLEVSNRRTRENNYFYGLTKTKIMDRASLSYAQIREYLTILTDDGLLHPDLNTQTYKTTEKDHRFLEIYSVVGSLMKEQI